MRQGSLRIVSALNETSGEPSLWDELYEYFYTTYFNPDLGSYENFDFGTGTLISLRTIVFGIVIGFMVAGFCTIFDKRVLGDFVRHLLHEECLSPDRSKTLYELGYHKNPMIRGSLRNGVSLRRVVRCVEEEAFSREVEEMRREYNEANKGKRALPFKAPAFRMEPENMHYYIPEDLKYVADVKFEKKGTNWFVLLIAFFLMIAAVFLIFTFLPDILQLIDNFISMVKPDSGVLN